MGTKEIKLLKNNDNRNWLDLQWINEFYNFLQGELPGNISIKKKLKLSRQQAFSVIWYLQEHFPLLPDHIEQCSNCGCLYDSYSQGHHSELTTKFYCSESCEPDGLYEKEQRAEKKKDIVKRPQ